MVKTDNQGDSTRACTLWPEKRRETQAPVRECAIARDNAGKAVVSIDTLSSSARLTHSNFLMLINRIVIPTLVHMVPFSTMEHHGNNKGTRDTN